MNSIGGYLGMEFPAKQEYHEQPVRLNTGRNALEYILRARGYKRIYIPYYSCDALLEPVEKLGIAYSFYSIDNQLEPIIDFKQGSDDCFLYVNYFGLKDKTVEKLSKEVSNLIIDNSQAFFSLPLQNIDTFYSCRKFFGVPDGAYVSINTSPLPDMPLDVSFDRCAHLLKNTDCGIESGYPDYLANEKRLCGQDIKQMSVLTQTMMAAVDYAFCKEKRNANFNFLHAGLNGINELKPGGNATAGPLSYPLLISNNKLRQQLITEKIYVPCYWPNVKKWAAPGTYEYFLSENILALPVDHRYNTADMGRIVEAVLNLK